METKVPVVELDKCRRLYGKLYEYIKDTNLCAGEKEGCKDTCQGDSGGPGVWDDKGRSYVIAVTSFGLGCGRKGKPGVYTRVTEYLSWIQSNAGQYELLIQVQNSHFCLKLNFRPLDTLPRNLKLLLFWRR